MSQDIIQAITECPMVKNMPTGISALLKELTKPDIDIDELISHLEMFPVVCVRLVMVANSAWAAPKTEITDVKRACMQLGLNMVKSISIALLISQQFNTQNCKGFNEKTFWMASLVTADTMQLLQKKTKPADTDVSTAHLIGLIHNLGLLAIAEIAPEKLSQAFLISKNTEASFSHALHSVLGISYLDATQLILKNWGLPVHLSHSYCSSEHETSYNSLLLNAAQYRNQLDLESPPFKIMDESQPESLVLDSIIEKSTYYTELCAVYCR